ncbi:RnfABCDGE type electron transport complex subunit G [Candidatus Omnitrophota bacterium]
MFRFIIVLTLVCVGAALVLGVTHAVTEPQIAAQKAKETKEALNSALPLADSFKEEKLDEKVYHKGYKKGTLVGYVFFAKGEGYAGPIDLIVGVSKRGKITGLVVLEQQETPGLGARCTQVKHGDSGPWFLRQFKGKDAKNLKLADVEALTGATITTEAIIKAVRVEVSEFLDRIK